MPPLSKAVIQDIQKSHAKQLAQFKLPGLRDAPGESPPPTLLADTIDWITANRAAVEAAQSARQSLLIIVVLAAQC